MVNGWLAGGCRYRCPASRRRVAAPEDCAGTQDHGHGENRAPGQAVLALAFGSRRPFDEWKRQDGRLEAASALLDAVWDTPVARRTDPGLGFHALRVSAPATAAGSRLRSSCAASGKRVKHEPIAG